MINPEYDFSIILSPNHRPDLVRFYRARDLKKEELGNTLIIQYYNGVPESDALTIMLEGIKRTETEKDDLKIDAEGDKEAFIPITYELMKRGLRLWAEKATEKRDKKSIGEGGDYIKVGEKVKWSKLVEAAGGSASANEITLYLEYAWHPGIAPYEERQKIKVEVEQAEGEHKTPPTWKDEVWVLPLIIEFELKHIEIDPKSNKAVNSGKDSIYRDEIVEIRIKIPPVANVDRKINLSIEPEQMRKELLPSRGEVQMYDFGEIKEDGTVAPDKEEFLLESSKDGEITIKAVFNKEGKIKVKVKSALGNIEFDSPEYKIIKRIRKYAIPFPGFPNHNPNKYDEEFVDAVEFWGNLYGHKLDTVDRIKAIAVAESNVGALVQNRATRPNDILTIGHPGDQVLATIRGNPAKWSLDLTHPKKPAADPRYKKLNYVNAGIGSSREAIKWGVLWLYVKAYGNSVNIEKNKDWTWAKRNKTPLNVINGDEEPEYKFLKWSTWDVATKKYNGGGVNNYMTRVNSAFKMGLHWNAGGDNKLWPIMSDKAGRP